MKNHNNAYIRGGEYLPISASGRIPISFGWEMPCATGAIVKPPLVS